MQTIMDMQMVLFLHLVFAAIWIGGWFVLAHGGRTGWLVAYGLVSAAAMLVTGGHMLFSSRPDLLSQGLFHLKLGAYAAMVLLALVAWIRPRWHRHVAWAGFASGLLALYSITALP